MIGLVTIAAHLRCGVYGRSRQTSQCSTMPAPRRGFNQARASYSESGFRTVSLAPQVRV